MDLQFVGVAGWALGLAVAVVVLAAIYRVATDRAISTLARLLWIAAVILFPLVGAIAWFLWVAYDKPGISALSTRPSPRN